MKKQLSNLGKTLNKKEQQSIHGGIIRCYSRFFCQYDCLEGEACAVPSVLGGALFGTMQNGQCCL